MIFVRARDLGLVVSLAPHKEKIEIDKISYFSLPAEQTSLRIDCLGAYPAMKNIDD